MLYCKFKTNKKAHLVSNTFHGRDVEPLIDLWNSVYLHVLLYNTEIIGKSSARDEQPLEKYQRQYTKRLNFPGNDPPYHEHL